MWTFSGLSLARLLSPFCAAPHIGLAADAPASGRDARRIMQRPCLVSLPAIASQVRRCTGAKMQCALENLGSRLAVTEIYFPGSVPSAPCHRRLRAIGCDGCYIQVASGAGANRSDVIGRTCSVDRTISGTARFQTKNSRVNCYVFLLQIGFRTTIAGMSAEAVRVCAARFEPRTHAARASAMMRCAVAARAAIDDMRQIARAMSAMSRYCVSDPNIRQ